LIATFSIDGLITLAAMLVVLGATQPGALRVKLIPWAIAVAVVAIFLATPLGSRRVSGETATSLAAAERGETTSTFDTRLYRWKTLLREWERRPVFGQGIGTTTTTEGTRANPLNFLLPHNEYIRYLVETGVVGVIILLTGLALLIRALFRRRALDLGGGGGGGSPASLAIAVVVGCLVNSLADNTLLNSPTGYAAALIIAAALATRGAEPKPIIAQPAT
jgi:O-antigen ligase